MHNPQHHITFADHIGNVHVTWVRAAVNDSIHIQVQMVKLWQESGVRNDLIDLGIALADPAVKLSETKSNNNNNKNR
jgi:hypothetical protein